MAKIRTRTLTTIDAISAAREAASQQFNSTSLSMSELGSECDRALWYSFRWASQHEKLTGQKLRLFETGYEQERRMIADLRMVTGIEVQDLDPDTGKQHKVYALGGHLRGKLDGLVQGLVEAPKTIHVLECKSHNTKNFKELISKGLKASKIAHWWQCQIYMHVKQIDRCYYMAVNKDTDDIWACRVEYDAVEALRMLIRLEKVISDNRAPSRISEDPDSYFCRLCKHSAVCHQIEFGRMHCRTCVRATPIIDKEDIAATWLCEKHNRTLSRDEQEKGCSAHLFLPDVVPGEQYDSGDDFIAYRMRDGSSWVDQEKPCTRFWYHPESDSLWSTDDGQNLANGEVEELCAEEYQQAVAYFEGLKNGTVS